MTPVCAQGDDTTGFTPSLPGQARARFGPADLLGRRVMTPDGTAIGTICGIAQLRCSGDFEEVRIENGRDLLFVNIRDLEPDETDFVLRQGNT